MQKWYVAIDLKSFYASVECVARGRDPLTTNLVVADASRTNKTICLAVTPSLKAVGVGGRPRLFEVEEQVKKVNAWRKTQARASLEGASDDAHALADNPRLALDYIVAPPRMALYMAMSTRIYGIYLKWIAPEDIYPYSVDEVFIDVTPYLNIYRMTPEELARHLIKQIYKVTGITATAGVGTNLYLAKVAMDILAKRMAPDENGVRLAVLDEMGYRRTLWGHKPITDFWRVGPGTAKRLAKLGMETMGDVARCSLGREEDFHNQELLYKTFGVNAELLIDHAWGYEPCTMADIKAYKPEHHSLSVGQVLQSPYTAQKARLVVLEMAEGLALDMVKKGLVCDHVVLTVGYDIENLRPGRASYQGDIHIDHYGRAVPKHARGTERLSKATASSKRIHDAVCALYDRITDTDLLVRRLTLVAGNVVTEEEARARARQQTLFATAEDEAEAQADAKERKMQEAVLGIKARFGKNAILRGTSLEEGATAIERNKQIGGHRA